VFLEAVSRKERVHFCRVVLISMALAKILSASFPAAADWLVSFSSTTVEFFSMAEEAPNEEVFRQILEKARNNDSSLDQINLNNLENGGSKPEWMNELLDALMANTHVTVVQLVNCNINNEGGKKIAELMTNNKAIVNLNLESNRIGPESMRLIAEGIEKNTTLVELKLTNQSAAVGNEAERILAKAIDINTTLQKCTLTLRDTASRNTIDRALTRNKEISRKARQAQAMAAKKAEKV